MTLDATLPRSAAPSSRTRLVVACMATSILADMLIWLRPETTAEYLNQRGLTNTVAGFLGTTELLTMAAVMLLSTRFAVSIRFRTLAGLGVLLASGATLATMAVGSNVPALIATRFVAALGFGLLALVPTTVIARLPDAQSAYGRIFAVSMVCNAAALSLLPWIGSTFHRPPGFLAFLIYATVLLPVILTMPSDVRYGERAREDIATAAPVESRRRIFFLAAGYASVALAYHAAWTFFMVLAGRAGLTPSQASQLTALTAICAIAGSLASAPLAKVIGVHRALSAITIGFLLAMLLMIYVPVAISFAISGCLVIFLHFMMFPAVLGSAARIDSTGKGSAIVSASGWLVGAAGAYVGGVGIDLAGYASLGVVAVVMLTAALLLFGAALRGVEREQP